MSKHRMPHTPAQRAKMSATHKAKWADPIFRALMIDAMAGGKNSAKSPTGRARVQAQLQKFWSDPTTRGKMLASRWPRLYNTDGTRKVLVPLKPITPPIAPPLKALPWPPSPSDTVTISRQRYERLLALAKGWLEDIDEVVFPSQE